MFEFKYLPMPGGLYDQHPDFLLKTQYIMMEEQRQRKKEEAMKNRKKMGGATPRHA